MFRQLWIKLVGKREKLDILQVVSDKSVVIFNTGTAFYVDVSTLTLKQLKITNIGQEK